MESMEGFRRLNDLQISDCLVGDLPEVLEIENSSFDCPYPFSLFQKLFSTRGTIFRVSRIDGKVVGYCVTARKDDITFTIVSLAVSRSFRRLGIGLRLLNDSIQLLAEKNRIKVVELQVSVQNKAAVSLYLGRGFERAGIIRRYYENGDDALVMRYTLGKL